MQILAPLLKLSTRGNRMFTMERSTAVPPLSSDARTWPIRQELPPPTLTGLGPMPSRLCRPCSIHFCPRACGGIGKVTLQRLSEKAIDADFGVRRKGSDRTLAD